MIGNIHDGFQFGPWQAFPARNILEGPPGEVHIEPKVMQVLVCLANDAGRVVSHDTLLNKVWEGRAFSDEPLSRCIFELRRALGESSKDPKYIETIPKSGYRLVATVESLATPEAGLPSGGRRRALAMLFVLILVAGTFVAYRSTNPGLNESSPAVVGSTSRVNSSGYSIAVLPFVNMSSEPEQEYFSDGLSEEVLNLLAQVPDLKVVGRTSSFSFKGKNEDPREVGATLGVKTVLEGSVRKSGDQVRVTAQLIDASDGALIWSQTFERTMSEVFALQDDVAAAIIDALQIHVSANPTRGRPTDNTEAYTLFLKASVQKRDGRFGESKESLLRAIELDPQFAEAHELLAYHHWKHLEQQQAYDVAAEALAIDPDLVLAQAVYQQAKIGTHLAGVEAFERAVRKKPNNLDLLEPFLWNIGQAGYHREVLSLCQRWVDIDPLSSSANYFLAGALYAAGRTGESLVARERADQLSGSDPSHWTLGERALSAMQDEKAIGHFEIALREDGYTDTSWVGELITNGRDPATGQAYLDRHIPDLIAANPEDRDDTQYRPYLWYLWFGFLDRYFEIILDHDPNDSRWDHIADNLLFEGIVYNSHGITAHPKYLEVAEAMGIIKIWEKRGPPDFCEKVGDQWVCE